jgi:uncharacterized membrane protein
MGEIQEKTSQDYFAIFIPTTPNATTGFLVYMHKDEITHLSIRVDEAIKLIISGGIMTPEKEVSEIKEIIEKERAARGAQV